MPDPTTAAITDEDAKLVTLARSSRARTGASEGAAVRDETGRTYSATTVDLRSLQLSAVQAAVAAAVASGARGIEGVVVVTSSEALAAADVEVARELRTSGALLHRADPAGQVVESVAL